MAFRRPYVEKSKLTAMLIHKWSAAVLDEGYIAFPKRLLRCAGRLFRGKNRLTQMRLVLALVDYARPDLERKPTLQYLSYVTGLSSGQLTAALKSLSERKLLTYRKSDEGAGTLEIDYRPLVKRIEELTADD